MRAFIDFIERWLIESRAYQLDKRSCKSCEKLVLLLENERRERAKLIDRLLPKKDEPIEVQEEKKEYKPISPKSWIQKRFELEEQDRQKAREAAIGE